MTCVPGKRMLRRHPSVCTVAFAFLVGCEQRITECDQDAVCFNVAPQAAITEPEEDATFAFGEDVNFRGLVEDSDDEVGALSVDWVEGSVVLEPATPDVDGLVRFTFAGPVGTHVVGLRVVDPGGEQSIASVAFTVVAAE